MGEPWKNLVSSGGNHLSHLPRLANSGAHPSALGKVPQIFPLQQHPRVRCRGTVYQEAQGWSSPVPPNVRKWGVLVGLGPMPPVGQE